jgi:predicted ester cyclase
MASRDDFDFSAELVIAGGAAARRNWEVLEAHTVAEWSCDLDATMATITRNDPFQIMYATGLHVRGFEAVREFYRRRMQTFQGQGFFARRWVVTDALAIGNGQFRGTPQGVFFGVATTGKRLCLPMTVWIHFADGLLRGEATYLDGAELRRQIEHGAPEGAESEEVW